jgi:cell division protein FtsN
VEKPDKKKTLIGLFPKKNTSWLVLLVFVSGWMFFLGVLVGRGNAPVKFDIDTLQKELTALKEADIKEQLKKVEVGSDSNKMQTGLGFYEALKDTKDKSNTFKSTKSGASSENQPSHPKAVSKVNKKINTSNNHRTDASRKSKTPSLSKDTESEKNLTIQAASFKAPKDADQMVKKFRDKGYPAYKIIGVVPGRGVWYRVRIGDYGNKTEAAAMLKSLKKEGYEPYLVNR